MYLQWKRITDIFLALAALLILSPLLLPIMLILKLTGEGYIFYYQKRIGYRAKPFFIIKFATMLKNSPNMGTGDITLRHDPRLLPLGKLLRMTKINELPQLINVLKGDMSLVGPRPLVEKVFNYYPSDVQAAIGRNKPGITGIGSIVFRDEEKLVSEADMPPQEFYRKVITPFKGALEVWYSENKSAIVDLKIVFLTVWVILFPTSKLVTKTFKNLPKQIV